MCECAVAGVIGLGSALYYMTTKETVRPGSHDMGAPINLDMSYLVNKAKCTRPSLLEG